MRIVWSVPVWGEPLASTRGDLVRARSLIGALRKEGHAVQVVADHQSWGARARVSTYRRLVRPLLPQGLAGAARDAGRMAHTRAHGLRVGDAARRMRAHLIVESHVHFATSGAVAARLSGVPLILDDCSPCPGEESVAATAPGLARRAFRKQVKAAAHLTTPTRQIRRRLVEEGVPADRAHVVPGGVDRAPFRKVDRASARRRLGLGDALTIAFVGSSRSWHRADSLLESLWMAGDPSLHLLLIGDGPGRRHLANIIETLGLQRRVTFTGALNGADLAAALVASDIGVLPASNSYGQPMNLLDFAAAELAIVAPDVPPVRDMLKPDATGVLVENGGPWAIADALTRLAHDPDERRRLGAAAHDSPSLNAPWRACARALLHLAFPRDATAPTPAPQHPNGSLGAAAGRAGTG